MKMDKLLLGVCDAAIAEDCQTSWQTNKLGGKPDWILSGLQCPPCRRCGTTLVLVAQIYCPLAHSSYHRTLYILACIRKTCWNLQESWRVLRSQIPDYTHASVPDPPTSSSEQNTADNWGMDAVDWGDVDDDDDIVTMATVNPVSGQKIESNGQEKISYADCLKEGIDQKRSIAESNEKIRISDISDDLSIAAEHFKQMHVDDISDNGSDASDEIVSHCVPEDLTFEPQSSEVAKFLKSTTGPMMSSKDALDPLEPSDMVFQAHYLDVVEELRCEKEELSHELELFKRYTQSEGVDPKTWMQNVMGAAECGTGTCSEKYEKAATKHGDRIFHKFLKTVSAYPQQVLRYWYGGTPLYISPPSSSPIPACSNCGSPRGFELQLMPTLVSLLKTKDGNEEGAQLEFGTVLIFTCKASCWQEGGTIKGEWTIVQPDPDNHLFKT